MKQLTGQQIQNTINQQANDIPLEEIEGANIINKGEYRYRCTFKWMHYICNRVFKMKKHAKEHIKRHQKLEFNKVIFDRIEVEGLERIKEDYYRFRCVYKYRPKGCAAE